METLVLDQQAPMTAEEHVVAGQLSLEDELNRMQAQESRGSMFDNFVNSRAGRFMAKSAVVLGGLIGAGEPLVASAAAEPVAHVAAAGEWTVYGGDPLFPGGVNSRHQFVADITSPTGQSAMRFMGLNSREIKAIDTAAREGKETFKHFPFGTEFKAMSFGINGASVDTNVPFQDPRYPNGFDAYDLKVNIKTTKTVHEKVKGHEVTGKETTTEQLEIAMPTKCGNIALKQESFSHHTVFPHAPHTKAPTPETPAPVTPTPPTPTTSTPPSCEGTTTNNGTNNGNGGNAQGGNCSTNKNCVIISSPNSVDCSPVIVTPPPTPPTPPAQEFPPTIVMENMPTEGGFLGDTQQFCAEATANPASDGVTVIFSDKYNMPMNGTYPDPNGDPNSYCTTETFNQVVPDEQVFATAIDNVDDPIQSASASSNPFAVRQSTGF